MYIILAYGDPPLILRVNLASPLLRCVYFCNGILRFSLVEFLSRMFPKELLSKGATNRKIRSLS